MNLFEKVKTLRELSDDPVIQFQNVESYLIRNGYQDLYDEMTAPGILTYQMAKDWFMNYYVLDKNEGLKMAHQINQEIIRAQPNGYYWGCGDFKYGYDNTPKHFKKVPNKDLTIALDELIQTLQEPNYIMYRTNYLV